MEFGKKQTLLLFLDKDRFDLYSPLQNTVFRFDLNNFVVNYEPKNQQAFEEQINAFIAENKIVVGNIIIILSERALFIKAFPPGTEEEEAQIQKFIDSVPFENTRHLEYPIEGGKLITAVNRDLYLLLKKQFEKVGFLVVLVTSVYSIKIQLNQDAGLDENVAKLILRQPDLIKSPSFEEKDELAPPTPTTSDLKHPKKVEKRLFVLLGVFGVLIFALIIVSVNALAPQPQTEVSNQITPTLPPIVPHTPTPVLTNVSSTPSAIPATQF